MARAYKCDRCGEFYEPKKKEKGDFGIYEIISTGEWGLSSPNEKDICPACRKKLAEWWNLER